MRSCKTEEAKNSAVCEHVNPATRNACIKFSRLKEDVFNSIRVDNPKPGEAKWKSPRMPFPCFRKDHSSYVMQAIGAYTTLQMINRRPGGAILADGIGFGKFSNIRPRSMDLQRSY